MALIHTVGNLISIEELIKNYRDADKFIVYCKECPNYEKTWACPPLSFDSYEYLTKYHYALIFGSKIQYTEEEHQLASHKDKTDVLMRQILKDARSDISEVLYAGEIDYPGSKAIFPGGCILCSYCSRKENKPCRFPEKMRYSFDSFGIDLSALSDNLLAIPLQWAKEGLPEYHTLITAMLLPERFSHIKEDLLKRFAS